jgi:hypothetical protein
MGTNSKEQTHLDTNFVRLLVSLLEDEVDHLSDLIGSHGEGLFRWMEQKRIFLFLPFC